MKDEYESKMVEFVERVSRITGLTTGASISEQTLLFSLMSKEDRLVGVEWEGMGRLHARFHSHHSVMLVSWQTEAQTHQCIVIQV